MQFAPWSLQLCGVGEAVPGSEAKLCKVLCVSQNLLIINAVSLCGQKSSKTCFLPHYSALNSGQHYLHERRFDRVRSVETRSERGGASVVVRHLHGSGMF